MAKTLANGFEIPAAWGDADTIETLTGIDLIDKAELVNVPFLIEEVSFRTSATDVDTVWITAQNVEGDLFQFTDSSTGVRKQLVKYFEDKNQAGAVDTDEPIPMRLAVPKGLRVSKYPKMIRGKEQTVKTYYLTVLPE